MARFWDYNLRPLVSIAPKVSEVNGNLLIPSLSFVGVEELVIETYPWDRSLACSSEIGNNWSIRRKAFSSLKWSARGGRSLGADLVIIECYAKIQYMPPLNVGLPGILFKLRSGELWSVNLVHRTGFKLMAIDTRGMTGMTDNPTCSPILPVKPGTVEGWFTLTFDWTRSTREVPCTGETGRGRDTLVPVEGTSVAVVVGWASGASGYWDVDEVRRNTQLKFRLIHFSIADCLSSWGVDTVVMRVGGRPHAAHQPAVIAFQISTPGHQVTISL